tara:strand:+ start:43 stop:231 length:189 start_codon:yes stop_codon:yes gene_type:complete
MKNLKLEMHCKGHGHPTTYEGEFALKTDWWDAPELDGVTVRVVVDEDGKVKTEVNRRKPEGN